MWRILFFLAAGCLVARLCFVQAGLVGSKARYRVDAGSDDPAQALDLSFPEVTVHKATASLDPTPQWHWQARFDPDGTFRYRVRPEDAGGGPSAREILGRWEAVEPPAESPGPAWRLLAADAPEQVAPDTVLTRSEDERGRVSWWVPVVDPASGAVGPGVTFLETEDVLAQREAAATRRENESRREARFTWILAALTALLGFAALVARQRARRVAAGVPQAAGAERGP